MNLLTARLRFYPIMVSSGALGVQERSGTDRATPTSDVVPLMEKWLENKKRDSFSGELRLSHVAKFLFLMIVGVISRLHSLTGF